MSQVNNKKNQTKMLIGNKDSFDATFREFYPSLYRFALTIIKSRTLAEEAVQDVFIRLWEKRNQLKETENIKSYLFRSVYNQCLWLIKKQNTQQHYEQQYALDAPLQLSEEERENWEAFKPHIERAVNNLPDKCRQIFLLRRYEGLTNSEISDYLNISVKTVENQLTIAVQKLRKELHPFIKNLIILFFIENL
jgi:RNA polymerase sigma-70 factor (ECF subfamily)